jgi:hypothetical protein
VLKCVKNTTVVNPQSYLNRPRCRLISINWVLAAIIKATVLGVNQLAI